MTRYKFFTDYKFFMMRVIIKNTVIEYVKIKKAKQKAKQKVISIKNFSGRVNIFTNFYS